MKNIFIAMLTILFFNSCSKDEPTVAPQPDPKTFQYRIKEKRDINNVLEESYQYNSNNQVVIQFNANGEEQIGYLYNNAGFLTNKFYRSGGNISYVLDVNGRVLEEIENYGSNSIYKKVFVYDSSGKIIEERNFKLINQVFVLTFNVLLYYNNNGKVTQRLTPEQTSILDGSLIKEESIEYEYDSNGNENLVSTKKALVANGNLVKTEQIKTVYDNVKPAFYPNSILSKNNPIESQVTRYSEVDGGIINQFTITATNNYNEANYITKKVLSAFGGTIYVLEKIN